MGGLRWLMPITFMTYVIGMMNLSGVPFFFSGAWTKEEILHATGHWPASHLPCYLMLAGVVLTALYMTRQIIYVFLGRQRSASEHAHESPSVMTIPLIVLAACSILFSIVATPAWPWLHAFVSGEPAHFDLASLVQPMLFVSAALVFGGILFGLFIYRNIADTDPLAQAQPALFGFLQNKMWLDEFYRATVVALSRMAAQMSNLLDRYFWDGLVRIFAGIGQFFGMVTANLDERGINAGVDETTSGTRGLGRVMSAWHSGQVQTYLGVIAVGTLALLILYAWLT